MNEKQEKADTKYLNEENLKKAVTEQIEELDKRVDLLTQRLDMLERNYAERC